MMQRIFLLFLFILSVGVSSSQQPDYPVIKESAASVADFIPTGWSMLDSAVGDLNKDGRPDVALVLQRIDSILLINDLDDTVLTQPRMLVILFKGKERGYLRAAQSNTFILKHDNAMMEDPYGDIVIDRGVLKMDFIQFYNMGSWYTSSHSYKFRFNGTDFQLIGADTYSLHRASLDFESFSYNFLTKKMITTRGNEEKGSRKTSTKTLKLGSLKTLTTFKAPYTWEIEKDIFL